MIGSQQQSQAPEQTAYFDVIIVGAGLSGIGSAVRIQRDCPDRSFAIFERRDAIGGTWDLFRYPGIRSDSDMHTLGYDFKPWESDKAIADGPNIRAYVNDTADEYGVRQHIRFGHKVVAADWCSADSQWCITVENGEGERSVYGCGLLFMCSGYYSYDHGHQPEFVGRDDFQGTWVHPQFWPEDLDHSGKKVVVIGSGATAMTLVPNMAQDAESVTMLQRSPTYVISAPSEDKFANWLRERIPKQWAYDIIRWRNTLRQQFFYNMTRWLPSIPRNQLLRVVRQQIGDVIDVDKHFTPSYNPWDQRLCLVPDDDLFKAIKAGKATVVTDHIERITENGIQLTSGEHLEADIIVSATGLELVILGGARFTVDGADVDFANEWTYKGMMCSNVPNMVQIFGYVNASWTLRSDLIAHWVCRVLNHMRDHEYAVATPRCPEPLAQQMPKRLWIDNFPAGYLNRALPNFPKQGDRHPWINPQNYRKDRKMFREDPLEDGALIFERARASRGDGALKQAS